jgi:hypothetical protein
VYGKGADFRLGAGEVDVEATALVHARLDGDTGRVSTDAENSVQAPRADQVVTGHRERAPGVAIAHNAHFSAILSGFQDNLLDFSGRRWLIIPSDRA